jgi:hypothetical protein
VQTKSNQVCGTICNDVVHLHSLADRSGNHGKSSHCTEVRRVCARTRIPSDPLCVCQVQRNRTTLQQGPVSQSGGGPAPHRSFQAVLCSQMGLREIQVDVRQSCPSKLLRSAARRGQISLEDGLIRPDLPRPIMAFRIQIRNASSNSEVLFIFEF